VLQDQEAHHGGLVFTPDQIQVGRTQGDRAVIE